MRKRAAEKRRKVMTFALVWCLVSIVAERWMDRVGLRVVTSCATNVQPAN